MFLKAGILSLAAVQQQIAMEIYYYHQHVA